MIADSTPMREHAGDVPAADAAGWRWSAALCSAAGSCSSYRPNIDSASSTKTSAKLPSTHGFCSAADSIVPASPAATPASA